jgi:hypothetical protein
MSFHETTFNFGFQADCYRVERTSSRAGIPPLWTSAFSRRTRLCDYRAKWREVEDARQGASLLLRFRNLSSNNRRERSDAGIAMAETIKKRVKSMKMGSMVDEIPVFLTK